MSEQAICAVNRLHSGVSLYILNLVIYDVSTDLIWSWGNRVQDGKVLRSQAGGTCKQKYLNSLQECVCP